MANTVYNYSKFKKYLNNPPTSPSTSSECLIFKVATSEFSGFQQICQSKNIRIIDQLDRQLEDLVRISNPSKTDKTSRDKTIKKLLADEQYLRENINWVYFPWIFCVVRILQEEDYFSIITNRNQFKITSEEQKILRQKTIGVVGLSVGGEAAVTIAQEHLCGTIKIADFDELDLSNLNRLNAGVDEIGILKTTICKRKILRINPYMKVESFPKGITSENMNRFLADLDLLVEECDGLEIKIPIRKAAKSLKINTIYAADERGLLSIEPYGYDTKYPIFHGILKESQAPRESFKDEIEFMKALSIWCGGWEKISARSKKSLMGMGKTICGYPQLASEARFAAGQLGNVARRLLLGKITKPFFNHIDLDEIIE